MNHFESSAISAFAASTGALLSAIKARCINLRERVPLLSVPGCLGGGGIWGELGQIPRNDLHSSFSTMQGPSKPMASTSSLLTYAAPEPAPEPPQPPIVKTQSKERVHVGGLHPTVDECVLYLSLVRLSSPPSIQCTKHMPSLFCPPASLSDTPSCNYSPAMAK